jgi:hypothetical protein
MAEGKSDLLAECNNLKVPFQDFFDAFCSRCLQKDCSRSQSGKSRFETRVATWEERLFTSVSRMDPSDERFSKINTQHFVNIDVGRSGEAPSWLDPREVETTKEFSIPAPQSLAESAPSPIVESPLKSPESVVTSASGLVNTPNRPGQIIGGKPTVLVSDPWKSTQPIKPGEIVVKPGAKIKLGR